MSEQLNMQALANLAKANEVRFARAADKKAIKRGELDPTKILLDVPAHWSKTAIIDLFVVMPRVGRVRAMRWCKLETVNPAIHIGDLTLRQRTMLARHLDVWSARRDEVRRGLEAA
jgi:hypothetical protein